MQGNSEAEDVPVVVAQFTNVGMRLEDFWLRQPAKQEPAEEEEAESRDSKRQELTKAEIATIRLYTGPSYVPLNAWLRGLGKAASGLR